MRTVLQALSVLLPSLWLLAAILHGMAFAGPRSPRVDGLRRWVLGGTLLVHAATFVVRWRLVGHFPISETWTTLSAVAFGTALLYAWIASRVGHPGSGGVVLGLVFLLQLCASGFGPLEPAASRPVGSLAFELVHVATMVAAAAALILSGVHGLLYLVLFRRMRERSFGVLFQHLPDLDTLARMTRRAALAGFVLSTIGLNVGIWMAHRYRVAGFGYTDPQVLLTLVLWIHFGVIAFSGRIRGFTARRASFAATAGLVALLFTLFLTLFPSLTFHATR
jgi:ABC-type transport system involved in cytochrome c biogenesis permease subunit